MYSIRNVLRQEPMAISGVIIAIVNAVLAFANLSVTADQLGALNSALVLILGAFYVRPLTASRDALSKLKAKPNV